MNFKIAFKQPSIEEYNNLRKAAEWPILEDVLMKKGLANSLFSVCVLDDDKLIGFGRVVGDDATYFHIMDVLVHPSWQRKNIGRTIMKELLKYIDTVAGKNTHIGLMCSKGREKFYADFGFIARPNEKFGSGMIKIKT